MPSSTLTKLTQRFFEGRESIIFPLLFGLIALALRLSGLDDKSLWGDEALSAWHSTYPALALWTQPITNKPPLYYLLTALFWSPGESEFALRLPAALLGSVVVALSWFLGRRLAGNAGAFWLALFMLLSDIDLQYSEEARQYILLTFAWLLLVLAMMRLLAAAIEAKQIDRIGLLNWALGALLLVQTHPVGLLYLAASQLAFWLALFVARPVPRSYLILPTVITLAAALTIAQWLLHALGTSANSFNWLQQPSPYQALLEWISLAGARNLVHLGGPGLALVASAILTLISVGGIVACWYRQRPVGVLLVGLMLLPLLTLWLMGLVKPVYMLRTISPTHLLLMAGLALAVSRLKRGQLLAGLALALVLATSSWFWQTRYEKEAWRDLSQQLHQQIGRDEVVLICENNLQRPLWFYLGADLPELLDLDRHRHRVMVWKPEERRWRGFRPAPRQRPPRAFWVIDRYHHCPKQIDRILYRFAGLYYQAGTPWSGHALTLTPWRLESLGIGSHP